ncbi:MAG: peptidase M14 [Bacteroidetes bacterium]|nr:peptidase M14 [Bacteroidota bacterium]
MKTAIILVAIICLTWCARAQSLETYFENSGGMRTPRYAETVEYCQKLARTFPQVHYLSFGLSPQGRDLPLLIVDKGGNSTPASVAASGNAVLLVQACIHSGECDGKDAGLMLLRDILTKKELNSLLDHVTILFIPIFNVDGHERFGPYNRINQNGPEEMGWRVTAQNLNLNRDYMKADAPEMQAWLKLYNSWLPDFFVDCHVTDGADYQYVLTYALETQGNMEKNLSNWTANVCDNYLRKEMESRGYPIFPYVQFRNWHDPRSGLVSRPAPPMLSQGYTLVQNRPGLLIETHMLKPYKTRVESTYSMLELVIRLLDKEYTNLKKLEKAADEYTSGKEFRSEPFPVNWEESFADCVMSDFKGFEYTMDTSDLSGGLWFKYDRSKPATWKIPTFDKARIDATVNLPEAYIIPPEWGVVIDRLKLHGVRMEPLKKEASIQVRMSRFNNVKWREGSYEGRHKVSYQVTDSVQAFTFPAGSMLVDMNQRSARVVAHLLEPKSPDSFASWGFFDATMEQKEYFESYVMETEARRMLAADPILKKEFESLKATDKKFASDPEAILYWFYSKTPWLDSHFDLYPVGRIIDRKTMDGLER